jgi:hypothetical protein
MPYDTSGNYTLPAGSLATPNTTALASQHNTPINDFTSALNLALLRDGRTSLTGPLTLVDADPTVSNHATRKSYVDALRPAKGPSAPSSPFFGQSWIQDNTPSATVWTLRSYDGADWIALGTIDTTANTFTPATSRPITWTPFVGATGTAVDFTGIPLTANEIFVYFASVSLNADGDIGIQLGNSGGFLATGYQSSSAILSGLIASGVNYNTAWGLNVSAGVNALLGLVTITRVDSLTSVMSSNLIRQGAQNPGVVTNAGFAQLTGFDRLRILRLAAGTFDQGGFVMGYR